MYEKVREFIERHIKSIGQVFVIAVVSLWILSQYIDVLEKWIIEQNLLSVIMVVLLVDIMTYLIEIKQGVPRQSRVFASQTDAYLEVRQFVEEKRPKKADLLEYSTATIHDCLQSLRNCNCEIRLLLQHPETAVTDLQKRRIEQQISDIVYVIFKHYDGIEARCYRMPGSLRGRNFDNILVSVGWYTYSSDSVGVYGHINPMINAYTDNEEGRNLQRMFNRAFEWLWEHPSTVPIQEVSETSYP